jgi:D-serine deaminase-like pyridoxal phosphate-dependent protein
MASYQEVLDTPASVVDEQILRANIEAMAEYARSRGIALRPHFKTHKTAQVARLQKESGAVGITCAKLGEAEVIADAGLFDSIFIANQIVGPLKTRRLAALMDRVRHVRVAVDSVDVAEGLQAAMAEAGKTLEVVIELNTGQGRAGVLPDEALGLAEVIRNRMPNLNLVGVMTHEGHSAKAKSEEDLLEITQDAGHKIVETAELLREHGFDVQVVSVGSTPGAYGTTTIEGITEMRPGTYVFRDAASFLFDRFGPENCALRILATVTSRPAKDRAIIDAGSKVLTNDAAAGRTGHGYILEYPEAQIFSLSEEHGWVRLPDSAQDIKIGEKVHVIPNHVCPTVNLTNELYLIRDGELVETWPVIARGKSR